MSSAARRWIARWSEQSALLLPLLARVSDDKNPSTTALLDWVRECRKTLADPPDPGLRRLRNQALDEIWEAAHANLYGDLGPAREHAAAALRHVQEMNRWPGG